MHATDVYPTWALCVLFGVLGACLASFLCVVAERVPAHRSINGRSTCICGRQLKAYENIPIVSWCLLRGSSTCCHSRIPALYVIAEAGMFAAFALNVYVLANSTPTMIVTDVMLCIGLLVVGAWRHLQEHPNA
jgi:leader peptidase (prepilin peptidase)/N-methyltransferase